MPYSGDPEGVTRDAVRLLCGDLSTSAEWLSDADYDYIIAATPNTYMAASLAATALAGKFSGAATASDGAGWVEKTVGDLKIKRSDAVQTAAQFKELAKDYRQRAAAGVTPYSGGMKISDRASNLADSDLVRPAFAMGLLDNTGAQDFGGSSTST